MKVGLFSNLVTEAANTMKLKAIGCLEPVEVYERIRTSVQFPSDLSSCDCTTCLHNAISRPIDIGRVYSERFNVQQKTCNLLITLGLLDQSGGRIAKSFNMDKNTASSTGCRWFWFKAKCNAKGCP
ncbi:hypothetical protein CerSpe_124500 [Prunus speciosa]